MKSRLIFIILTVLAASIFTPNADAEVSNSVDVINGVVVDSISNGVSPNSVGNQGEELVFVPSEQSDYVYKFPEIEPEYGLNIGYKTVSQTGRTSEYEHLKDSVTFMGNYRTMPFPHRIYLEVDYLSAKDMYADANYAYKDLVLFRWLNRGLYHNLDNFSLYDPDTSTNSPGISTLDSGEKYGISEQINNAFLRIKAPDFPLHFFVSGQTTNKEGTRQVRYLGGSGYFNDIVRTSRSRDIDFHTTVINIGANSHLGPVELEVVRTEKKFESLGERVFTDRFTAGGNLPAGDYSHNLIPSFKGSTTSLKLHTSYTGKLVGSATLSVIDQQNQDSKVKSEYLNSMANITWMPFTDLTFFLKYRHNEYDIETPSTITFGGITNSVPPAVTSKTDTLSGNLRYRPSKTLTLNAELKSTNIARENAAIYKLPDETVKNTFSIGAISRLTKNMKLDMKYTRLSIDAPAYNSEPDASDKGSLSLFWHPVRVLSGLFSYDLSRDAREGLIFEDAGQTIRTGKREAINKRTLGMITFMPGERFTLSTSYSYMENNIKQSLMYDEFGMSTAYVLDDDVQYKNRSNSFGIGLGFKPCRRFTIGAGANIIQVKMNFYPNDSNAVSGTSIGSLSEIKLVEQKYTLNGDYIIRGGWELGISYSYDEINDEIDNPYLPVASDGNTKVVMFKLSKRWQ